MQKCGYAAEIVKLVKAAFFKLEKVTVQLWFYTVAPLIVYELH